VARHIEPGSKWVLQRGVHSGTVIEVEGRTFAGAVKYRVVKKGDNTGSSREDDDGRVHTKPADEFLTLYERDYKANGAATQPAFRQDNSVRRARKAQEQERLMPEPVQLLGSKAPVPNGHYVHPGDSGLGITVEMVTPAMAQAWLDRGGVNRKPSERAILKLMHAIQLGEWDLTGETIKLDSDGKVRDGQHRLTAIVRTGITVPTIVVRGISESAFDKIDQQKSRNMADVLAIHGHHNQVALATAARGLILIESYGRFEVGGVRLGTHTAPSPAQGLAYIEAHPEVATAVMLADRIRKEAHMLGGTGLWAIALTMFWRVSPDQTQVFVTSLIEGANLERGNPILKLRNQYRVGREWQSNNAARERLLAIIIKAWNFWRRDETVQMLTWHDSGRSAEKFPVAE